MAEKIHRPYPMRDPEPLALTVPFDGDIEAWLTKIEVSTPLDDDRKRELDRWAEATDEERGRAFYELMSIVDAMAGQIPAKPPLQVRFPRPYRGQAG